MKTIQQKIIVISSDGSKTFNFLSALNKKQIKIYRKDNKNFYYNKKQNKNIISQQDKIFKYKKKYFIV